MKPSDSTPDATMQIVLTFPGQGAYHPSILRELYTSYPQTAPVFELADAVAERFLGHGFLPLVTASSPAAHAERLAACPDLDQLGIYLTEVLVARLLMEQGLRPALLVGHSFGDLAALTVAGVYPVEAGLQIVCQRVMTLQALDQEGWQEGRMAALSGDPARARALLAEIAPHRIEISVVNHPRQTVLSGPPHQLEALAPLANERGLTLTMLKSRYPFHSSFLRGAVLPFKACLKAYPFQPPATPVFLAIEQRRYTPDDLDLADALAAQLVEPLSFDEAVHALYGEGYRVFVECGAGDIVSKLIQRNLPDADDLVVQPAALPKEGVRAGLRQALALGAAPGLPHDRPAPPSRTDSAGVAQAAVPQTTRMFPEETCPDVPVAIVSMGCVLPGSSDPETYWRQIQDGVSGVVDLAALDPDAGRDFLAGSEHAIVSDKTYTLLHGAIREIPYDAALLDGVYTEAQFDALTRGQKLLALATAQNLAGLRRPAALRAARLQCILGATADGSAEYDDALFVDSLHAVLDTLDEPEPVRRAFAENVEALLGYERGAARHLAQHPTYQAVVGRMLGDAAPTYVVDAACSSSLYAIDLGVKALRAGEADAVLAGGVFAAGPANSTLFAQFRGLTPRQSRPLDAAADGVVFGDGAGVVTLKRLPDALADGDEIHAVIRGTGLSSDGKSPSINVPQSSGQSLAMRRAYEQAHVSVDTIQYIEAHATATPVGDAVEFASLARVMQDRDPALPPVALGSVKALVGHTGWASGAASVIKLCKAFAARQVPRQYHFEQPNPKIDLDGAPFTIARAAHPWPENVGGFPRRAGVNAFGFGGTNAHLILEAFDPAYHRHLCRRLSSATPSPAPLAVVGLGSLFPAEAGLASDRPAARARFDRAAFRLPAKKLLLPDVTDHMDASQYLAALAAEQVFNALPNGWLESHRDAVGVVLGLTAKTERGAQANERLFLDRLHRLFREQRRPDRLPQDDAERLLAQVADAIRARVIPSGPYTLPGFMPNVAAGRVASLFHLQGPNLVVDQGAHSLVQAFSVAQHLLAHGDCAMVLAGGLHAAAHTETEREAAFLVALTSLDTARREGLPVLATLDVTAPPSDVQTLDVDSARCFGGAQGVVELREALDQARQRRTPVAVCLPTDAPDAPRTILLGPDPAEPPATASRARDAAASSATHAYVQATPIQTFAPDLFPDPATAPATALADRRILFLTDQPDCWAAFAQSGALDALTYTVARPSEIDLPGATPIDLSTDEAAAATLAALDAASFDTIIAVKNLEAYAGTTLLTNDFRNERTLLDLLFAVCRRDYARIQRREAAVVTLCLHAYVGRQLDPYTGLMAGFMKSLAREAPDAACRIVHTDEGDPARALAQAAAELGQPAHGYEVCYRDGLRHRMMLRPVARLAQKAPPLPGRQLRRARHRRRTRRDGRPRRRTAPAFRLHRRGRRPHRPRRRARSRPGDGCGDVPTLRGGLLPRGTRPRRRPHHQRPEAAIRALPGRPRTEPGHPRLASAARRLRLSPGGSP